MVIREYNAEDCREMAELFYNTVHGVNARGYCVLREQQVTRKGVILTNYVMEK